MVRDLELVRKILAEIEEHSTGIETMAIGIEPYSCEQVDYHLSLMIDAELVEGKVVNSSDGMTVIVFRMTWDGHDFLDATKSKPAWQKTRQIIGGMGGVSFEVCKAILTAQLKEAVGLS